MNEMIEKIAIALCETDGRDDYWKFTNEGISPYRGELYRGDWRELARVALCAMREPTAEMLDEVWASALAESASGVWRDMINAAIGDGK